MKKRLLIIPILLLWITFASESFPAFPMTIYWNTNLAWWTLKVYDWANQEIGNYEITSEWKYWSDNVFILPLSLNSFNWGLTFKATYNWKNYLIDSINDSNKWDGCPTKESITFVSKTCRYDLTFKEETTNNGWNWWWWGWGWGWGWWWGWGGWWWGGGWWVGWTTDSPTTNTWTTNTWNTESWTTEPTVNDQQTITWNPQEVLTNGYTRELNDAYTFAFKNGITTMKSIDQANMNWSLNRIAMAKMLSQYAINILEKKPDTNNKCDFWDVSSDLDKQYNDWVTLACQLGIMWVNITNFRPNDEVTRAEFGTALSRMLFGLADWTDNYYSTHLAKLKKEKIISNDDPTLKELRWYVMLMLMRSAK